ncbi:uncharacterized protein AKAW2_20489A [Aspergillus luchuensis]|uniref:Uncharacterized protein n=1 Tax=Aspergillus kawachii TaxID=1069201 RepID=A0A7R7W381_ASPKA|nr:uncharacterized protein AKAW2_20489A [Aspergillus luchuensis]BCR95549.1 hypothetical protein AKAW2_20489A [Aspergillus luchuensis]
MSLLIPLHWIQNAAAGMSDIESPSTARAELPRQFSFLSTLALGYSITNSWAGYAGILSIPLVMGGSPTAFFGLVVASIACCFISKHALLTHGNGIDILSANSCWPCRVGVCISH